MAEIDLRLNLLPGAPNPWDGASVYLPGGTTEIAATGGTISSWSYANRLDVRIDMSMDTWVPPTNAQSLFFRYASGSSGTLGFWMRVNTDGRLGVSVNSSSLSTSGFRVIGGEPGERLTIRSYSRIENVFGTDRLVLSQYVGRDGIFSERWESLGTRYYAAPTSGSTAGQPRIGLTDAAPGMVDVRTYGLVVIYDATTVLGIGPYTGSVPDPGDTTVPDGYSAGTTWGTLSSPVALNATEVQIPRERIRLATWAVGTPDVLAGPVATTAKFVISDPDRELDPDNTAGPYYGLLRPRTPVQLYNYDDDIAEWTGFVEDFVPQWSEPAEGTMTLVCGDALSLAADTPVRRDEIEDRIVELRPEVYLTFDQLLPDGAVINSGVGTYANASAPNLKGQQTCIPYSNVGGAISLDGTAIGYIGPAGASIPPLTLMFWTTAKATSDLQVVFRDYQVSPAFNRIGVYFNTDGKLVVDDNNGAFGYTTSNVQLDGSPHFFFLRFNDTGAVNVFRDGVGQSLVATPVSGSFTAHQDSWYFGSNVDLLYPFTEAFDELAIFTYTVDETDAAAIYDAAVTARTPDEALLNITLSAGINRNQISFFGSTTSADLRGGGHGGKTLLECIGALTAHEGGHCYVNEYGTVWIFPSNFRSVSPGVSLLITDEDVALDLYEYRADEIVLAPNSVSNIVNTVEVVWSGVTTTFQDKASVSKYGARRRQIQSSSTTYAAAQAAAQKVLDRYAEPKTWVTSVRVDLSSQTQSVADFLAYARSDNVIRIRRQPLETGSVIQEDYWVDQLRVSVAGPTVVAELVLSPL